VQVNPNDGGGSEDDLRGPERPIAGLTDSLRRRSRQRSLRRRHESQLRDLAGLAVELRRLDSRREDLIARRAAVAAATEAERVALGDEAPRPSAPVAESAEPESPRSLSWRSTEAKLTMSLAASVLVFGVLVGIWSQGGSSSGRRSTAAAPVTHSTPHVTASRHGRRHARHTARHRARRHAARRPAVSAKKLGTGTLSPGSTGGDVRLLQRLLHVPVTGTYGPRTVAAVKRFQRVHKLPTTGVTATRTHAALKKAFP
jgi:hypothetical protein